MLTTPALLALASTSACAQGETPPREAGSPTLIAYLTRSGNTRVIAATLQRALRAGIFEIKAAQPYPEDYEEHVARATRERDGGIAPPLAAEVPNIAAFDEVFLGFPVWGQTAPAPIRSFLKAHDWRGKTLRPFITHGGYGIGSSMDVVRGLATSAQIAEPFVMEADQERRTLGEVRGWLEKIEA